MSHQQLQDVILNGGEGYRLPIHGYQLGAVIHRDRPYTQKTRRLLSSAQSSIPPQLALYPGDHFQGIEGLGDIVIRTDIQAQNLVVILAFRRQQNDGNIASLPQLGSGANAIQLGHHNVHENQVNIVLLHRPQSFIAVIRLDCLISFAAQIDIQGGNDIFVIITDQNGVHAVLLLYKMFSHW